MKPRVLTTLLTLILALALGASGPLRAFAHGHGTGVVAMVICGEQGAETVYLDASGHPVESGDACLADPCDACLLSGAATLADQPAIPVPEVWARALASRPEAILAATRLSGPAQARGPPTGGDFE